MSLIEELERVADCLLAEDLSALTPVEALQRSERLHRCMSKLHLVRLQSVADVDARSAYVEAGAPTTSAWLSSLDADYDRREVALAKKLTDLPLVSEGVASGRLPMSSGKALQTVLSMLRRKVDRPDGLIDGAPGEAALETLLLREARRVVAQCRGGLSEEELFRLAAQLRAVVEAPLHPGCGGSQISRLEAAFLVVAEWVEPAQLRSALGLLVGALLPQELEAAAARAFAERGMILVRRGGGWHVDGALDLETGELLFVALDAEMRRDSANLEDTVAAGAMREEGLDPTDPQDLVHVALREFLAGRGKPLPAEGEVPSAAVVRSRAQRMHDGLFHLLSRYLGAGLGGTVDKAVAHVSVGVGIEHLAGEPGALAARAASGSLLPLSLVKRWLCDSEVTRFVMGLGGRAIEASHTERTTKAHERRAKYLETGGVCQCRGCRSSRAVPGLVLTPHHVFAYAVHGRTSHEETVLLCPASHHDVHEGGRTIQLKDGRWLNASGWVAGVPRSGESATGPPGEAAA